MREEDAQRVDLSHRLTSGGTVFPGDPQIRLAPAARIEVDGFAVTSVTMGSHSGTHVDAPSHTVAGGRTMDDVDVARLIGRAHLLRVPGLAPRERIGLARLEGQLAALPDGARIVLLVTGWDRFWGDAAYLDHPFLDGLVGEHLRDRGVDVLGVDTLNPDETAPEGSAPLPVHEALLGADRLIIENLRGLADLPASVTSLELTALPLPLGGADGAPVRAIARIPAEAWAGCP
ncbi:cyclase family protein [Micrococcus flavus]|uniref:Kynurenine formamidase n=1 Tax=Micrococcus flavus TaxID=384602 RepID=A0A4Y8WZT6_9MICC|nr:cyclase family protein [Micrococcus flavus]MBB4881767.1 kynurenine formamidase [Micrococcus flavus]TFI01044.1 cyclase family protein [Micrococcus flavus]GGK53313.1 cyclase [Micrococcus flavus]